MLEGTNSKMVGWIGLAAYLQDSKKYYASLKPWLILGGLALLFDYLECQTPQRMFQCKHCGVVLPDSEEYGLNTGAAGWEAGMCKGCMFKVSDGYLPNAMGNYATRSYQ
jgi:hypothetical protein